MVQSGSSVRDARNWSSATSYQKECSAATPRRKFACAWFEQEVGKATVPSLSSLAGSASFNCCPVVQAANITVVTKATRTSTALFENRVNGIGLPFVRPMRTEHFHIFHSRLTANRIRRISLDPKLWD